MFFVITETEVIPPPVFSFSDPMEVDIPIDGMYLNCYVKKTVMVNNSTNSNKMNYKLSPQTQKDRHKWHWTGTKCVVCFHSQKCL